MMMDGILTQRVTPLLKCVVLFLFIFTAKVLTSRPQDSEDSKNSIHYSKPSYYVRTFTKYHHRRTIEWNNAHDPSYWPLTQDQPKNINKRSVEVDNYPNDFESRNFPRTNNHWPLRKSQHIRNKRNVNLPHSKEYVSNSETIPNSNLGLDPVKENKIDSKEKTNGKSDHGVKDIPEYVKRYRVKAMQVFTTTPKVIGPTISCLYKIQNVVMSVTPSYNEDDNQQNMIVNDNYERGVVSNMELDDETIQIEKCANPRASCYALWHQDKSGNITILGQGCWKPSNKVPESCVSVRVTSLPATGFCTCAPSLCNSNISFTLKELSSKKAQLKSDSSIHTEADSPLYAIVACLATFIIVFMIVMIKLYCKPKTDKLASQVIVDKGEIMGSGPDSLATGLFCVDNLTLIQHIGQGKFGSVWRGCLGSTPVAVKIYSNVSAWQKESTIYSLPQLAHPNLLKYYGSDSRMSLGGGREHLVVLQLCECTLRQHLRAHTLTWPVFAHYAHNLASALAHLHTATNLKPAIAHRDVNSNNVLVTAEGLKLSDLDLAHPLPARQYPQSQATEWVAGAGTARYLPPEALEGALDAAHALHAADMYAAALVLWEMLWRTSGAHAGRTPPYMQPYQHVARDASLPVLQNLVSRNKVRPPLPKGPVQESRALKIACDTCEECWDHDAEARLTAVCVEERMNELKLMLQSHGPIIHDNKLHPHQTESTVPPPETDKNSNCTSGQSCDVTTPLLYPHPHIGRNALIERNTHTNTPTNTVQLIHKSLKDITATIETPRVSNIEENCLSVARISHNRVQHIDFENADRLNEIRSYQRPLDYVQNDVSSVDVDRGPKRTNILHDVTVHKPKWGIKKFLKDTFNKSTKLETEVKLLPETSNGMVPNGKTKTSIVNEKPTNYRPPNLVLNQNDYNFETPCTLSPPNKTLSPNMIIESEINKCENRVFGFKELPTNNESDKNQGQIFAVIVPKAKPTDFIEMRAKNSIDSSDSMTKYVRTSMSSQSIFKSGHSESEDSTIKKRLSCDNRIISNSGGSSRASINLELQYIDNKTDVYNNESPFDINSDCSSSEDEHLLLLSEGTKITMHTIPKSVENAKKTQNEVLKEASIQVKTDFCFNKFQNKYSNFDNEFSDPNDKENLANTYSGDNPVYLAALNGEIDANNIKYLTPSPSSDTKPRSPKPSLKGLTIKRQHSLEQVSEIFSSAGDISLLNPAGRVKTPGDLPVAVRRARRDRALQKSRASEGNRLSLYDDKLMFGNSL